jgi:protease IV
MDSVILNKWFKAWLREQKRARWWRFIGRMVWWGLLLMLIFIILAPGHSPDYYLKTKPHTAFINIIGEISADNPSTNAHNINKAITSAITNPNTKGIIIHINSPGGSAVQSGLIYDHIKLMRAQHPKTTIDALCDDMCASGGYYIATAADRIYANRASLIGSIGVVMHGFGYTDGIKKLGIERRIISAGTYKTMLDPFVPVNTHDTRYMTQVLQSVHQQFIDAVKNGRGQRLTLDPAIAFSGLVWCGETAKQFGLIDDLQSMAWVAKHRMHAGALVDYTPSERLMDRIMEPLGLRTFMKPALKLIL